MVFYLKYRSQKIDELDNAHVRETLLSILSKDPPHAFLFTGPKGLGKTSAARIVAKAVNCSKRSKIKDQRSPQGHYLLRRVAKPQLKAQNYKKSERHELVDRVEPCNECDQCISITNGTNMDVIEIDAASNRGIDEIRDLREKIWLAPLAAHKKVYIIDEVHMLTTEAFNALLKTIEEPPAHAMFVLCTTEPQKVPATILSRCFHVQFNLATEDEIVRSLKRIVSGEKLSIDDDVLPLIAQRSEGGFRDATKILEGLVYLAGGKHIKKVLFESVHKTASLDLKAANLLEYLSSKQKNVQAALLIVRDLVNEGIDIRVFIQLIMRWLHKMLLQKMAIEDQSIIFLNDYELEDIKQLSLLFDQAYQQIKYAVVAQLPLELAIIEFTTKNKFENSTSPVIARRTDKEIPPTPFSKGGEGDLGLLPAERGRNDKKGEGGDEVTVAKLRKEVGGKLMAKALYGSAKQNIPVKQDSEIKKANDAVIELMHVPASGEVTKEWMEALWKSIISEMRQYNHTIAGVLRSCVIRSYDRKLLVIGAGYEFHKERLDDKKARESLRSVCKMLTGNDVDIEVELNNKS